MGALPAASGVCTWRVVGCAFTLMLFCAAHNEMHQYHILASRHQDNTIAIPWRHSQRLSDQQKGLQEEGMLRLSQPGAGVSTAGESRSALVGDTGMSPV